MRRGSIPKPSGRTSGPFKIADVSPYGSSKLAEHRVSRHRARGPTSRAGPGKGASRPGHGPPRPRQKGLPSVMCRDLEKPSFYSVEACQFSGRFVSSRSGTARVTVGAAGQQQTMTKLPDLLRRVAAGSYFPLEDKRRKNVRETRALLGQARPVSDNLGTASCGSCRSRFAAVA